MSFRIRVLGVVVILVSGIAAAVGHEHTWHLFRKNRELALAKAAAQAEDDNQADSTRPTARLKLGIVEAATGSPLAGLLRVTNLESGQAVPLGDQIHRAMNWYSVPAQTTLTVPRARLRIEAFHGIETLRVSHEIDLTAKPEATLRFQLPRIYDPGERGYRGGNTHVHLNDLSYAQAVRYLQLVPKSDGLDVLFLSHLRRIPDERTYISNVIVENDLRGGELARIAPAGTLLGNGQEHRHNYGRGGEGYGHVMLLKLKKLIRPVSIGPGIMRSGTDGIPIGRGIREARRDGATIIWCHNHWGLEDVPNWVTGVLHAQNIFDGGSHGSYEESFYKYLNVGLKVPFSTGTDWFVYDFSRVYIPMQDELTIDKWLGGLAAGRSYITNGTFLEFQVDDHHIGDQIDLAKPGPLRIRGRAVGRNDFQRVELIHNGKVVHSVASRKVEGHFQCDLRFELSIQEPGWIALRIPPSGAKNELDRELFAHTSPIYVTLAGRQIFHADVARQLIREIEKNQVTIRAQSTFANDAERYSVLEVHRRGIAELKRRMAEY